LKNLRRFLVVGEKEIFRELAEILVLAEEANSLLFHIIVENYKGKALAEAMLTIRMLEKKSDDIAFKVGEDITGGAVNIGTHCPTC